MAKKPKGVATAPPIAVPPQAAVPKGDTGKQRPPEKQAEYQAKKDRARAEREAGTR